MSNLKSAQDVHHQLEFYLVALAFTTVAFATQTGKFSGFVVGDLVEALSWALFVLSGILGLWRLGYLPVAYRAHDAIRINQQRISEYEDDDGYRDAVAALRVEVAETEPQLHKIQRRFQRGYAWQIWLLVAGLCLLITARIIAQVVEHY